MVKSDAAECADRQRECRREVFDAISTRLPTWVFTLVISGLSLTFLLLLGGAWSLNAEAHQKVESVQQKQIDDLQTIRETVIRIEERLKKERADAGRPAVAGNN